MVIASNQRKTKPLAMDLTYSFLFILLLPLFAFLLFHHLSIKKPTSQGLKPHPLIGHLPHFIKHRHRFLDWISDVLTSNPSHTMGLQIPFQDYGILTANPLNVEHILKTNFGNYPKGQRSTTFLQDFLGQGIFNSDGEQWRHQRKLASYEFNKRSLRNFVVDTVQLEIENRLLPLLRRAEERDEVLDFQDILESFGFDNICKVAFNEDPACLSIDEEEEKKKSMSKEFKKAFGDAQSLSMVRFMDVFPFAWRIKKMLNVGSEKKLRKSMSIVHEFAMKIIRDRRNNKDHDGDDLLSRFSSENENSEEFLRDIVISFVLAGRETTSSALSWFFWLVSTRPDVEEKIVKEVEENRARHGNFREGFDYDKLREMQYLHAAVTESMRLYPPVAIDTLACKEDDTLPDGNFVGKGWFVSYSAYAMGRLEEIWGEDWGVFQPERWLEDGVFKPENPFKFPVFHAGPRMCLGKEMAYIQMKSVAASVLEEFKVEVLLEKGRSPEHVLSMTLRMRDGLPVQVKRRERS
ncbi:Cytochrome P450 E-class group I protein [Dioscorea alata]|uniref:Cytochrome P450 E-class group I protein n=4 Tax=Dioscorea alata TaxID=55571 RepID=A0ACB7VWH0_DIOAL|nr:Cytochrome P450 E-class group I protein [Dioscorea alata]KAH7679015.1 Cytochrome P450 E-class group I protein [Dioscorea alata]KAH7679016.1 Cytochrome P450 E-class group I protein [Dioscorea alata]KAH7679017.1 Cytochrome P450 E-class group I protein [Dioscorea alata]